MQSDVGDGDAVDDDTALGGLQQAKQRQRQRRLAGAGASHNTDLQRMYVSHDQYLMRITIKDTIVTAV